MTRAAHKTAAHIGFVLLLGSTWGHGQQGITRPAITPVAPVPQKTESPATVPAIPGPVLLRAGYILGTDDSIQVNVWKEPALTGSLLVRPDGMISLPLVGDVKASGLTPLELSASITERLKKFLTDPLVTVTVIGANSQRVYFIGEVVRPGPVALTPDMTLLQAVSSVGGVTAYADGKHMYILRGAPGQQQRIAYNYKKSLKSGGQQGIVLQAGDTIVVP